MSKTNEMVKALETFVIQKVQSLNENTSPEEVMALAELVKAINSTPRTIECLALEESVLVSAAASND